MDKTIKVFLISEEVSFLGEKEEINIHIGGRGEASTLCFSSKHNKSPNKGCPEIHVRTSLHRDRKIRLQVS